VNVPSFSACGFQNIHHGTAFSLAVILAVSTGTTGRLVVIVIGVCLDEGETRSLWHERTASKRARMVFTSEEANRKRPVESRPGMSDGARGDQMTDVPVSRCNPILLESDEKFGHQHVKIQGPSEGIGDKRQMQTTAPPTHHENCRRCRAKESSVICVLNSECGSAASDSRAM
jgi:hypothetical protein